MMMTQSSQKNIVITTLIVVCIAVGTLGAVWGGPALGDHETIVAQCARNMRLTGDWLVPYYLGDAYVRKPPLPYWMIAGLSYLFPKTPKPDCLSRLWSPVCSRWRRLEPCSCFGNLPHPCSTDCGANHRCGGCIRFVLSVICSQRHCRDDLTFCCTWAHVHFWFATSCLLAHPDENVIFFLFQPWASECWPRTVSLVMVAMPIIFWWYTQRPFRVIASSGGRAWRSALTRFQRTAAQDP